MTSAYDEFRLRTRIVRYNLGLLRIGGFLEILGVLLGIGGLLGTIGAAETWLAGASYRRPLVIVALVLLVLAALGLAHRRLGRLHRAFVAAARTDELAEQLRGHMQAGMKNDRAFHAMERVYVPVIKAANEALSEAGSARRLNFVLDNGGKGPFLAVVMPAEDGDSLDRLLDRELVARDRESEQRACRFAEERQKYMRALRKVHPRPGANPADDERGDNLVLDRIMTGGEDGSLSLRASIATYGEIVRTSDALLNEFALFAYLCRDLAGSLGPIAKTLQRLPFLRVGRAIELTLDATLRQLPWRRAVHGWCEQPSDILLRPTSRAAGLGVAVTMIQEEAHVPTAYIARRSSVVGTYPDVRHVLPAGMCNAKEDVRDRGAPLRADFLKWTMLGELLEECYSVDELAGYHTEDWVKNIEHHCREHRVAPEAPTFTGIGFDLLNLRPEVCAYRVVVRRSDDDRPLFKANWEYSPSHGVGSIPLRDITTRCDRTDFVQSGVASLALAAEALAREPQDID